MLTNYFKIAYRTLRKNKLFAFINIFGLALSMSVCMLVMINLKEQLSYDNFHPNEERTYRILSELTNEKGNKYRFAATPLPLLDYLTSGYDLTEKSARILLTGDQRVIVSDKKQLDIHGVFADSSFFSLFGFPFESGNKLTALQSPNSVVLTKDMAERLFGAGVEATGKSIEFANWGNFIVTAVLNKPIGKSHLDYDAYLSMSTVAALEKTGKISPVTQVWDNFNSAYTYVQLRKGVSQQQLDAAVSDISRKIMAPIKKKGDDNLKFESQALGDIILGEELLSSAGHTGSRSKVYAEIAIALIILICACFNYTNLSIARSLNRGKEVGIRKISGALRVNVFLQFVFESVLIAMLALALGYLLLNLMINNFGFIREILPNGFHFDLEIFIWFLAFSFFAGLLAGSLPAWALSSFKPVQVLKNLSTVKLFGSSGLRKSLIVVQFTLSLVIVIFTIVFSRQFDYMANADPLFNRDNILTVRLEGADPTLLASEISRISGIEQVSASSDKPGKDVSGVVAVKRSAESEPIGMDYYDADAGFAEIFKLKFLAGSSFPPGATIGNERYTIINETALKVLNFKSAGEAVGQQVFLSDSIPVQITGVVGNFYYRGMEFYPGPLLLRNRPDKLNYLVIRARAENSGLPSLIAATIKQHYPYHDAEPEWLKKSMHKRYAAVGVTSMLGFLAFITITIACLGLLGMVTYITQTRYKEIGIRKVMGAGVWTIMTILSRGFVKLVLIAGAIGLPLGWMAAWFFLNIFSNRVAVGWDALVLSLFGMLLLVLITIGSQIYKVAVANPVEALRNE